MKDLKLKPVEFTEAFQAAERLELTHETAIEKMQLSNGGGKKIKKIFDLLEIAIAWTFGNLYNEKQETINLPRKWQLLKVFRFVGFAGKFLVNLIFILINREDEVPKAFTFRKRHRKELLFYLNNQDQAFSFLSSDEPNPKFTPLLFDKDSKEFPWNKK